MKTLKTLLLFLSGALLLTTCGPDDKEPIEPEKEQKQPKPRVKDSDFENRTWQFMGYGNTDSVQLDLPEDAALYSLILSDSLLTATIPAVSCIAKYTLTTDKKISIDSLTGSGVNESLYINALKNLVQAHTYEVSNEVLKIFYSEKEYLLFVEKNELYPKNFASQLVFIYPLFELKAGTQIIINSQEELEHYMYAPPTDEPKAGLWPYTECMYPHYNYFDVSKQVVDFSKYSIILGSVIIGTDARHTEQKIIQIGNNAYYYHVKLFQKYDNDHKFYYGIIVNKIPSNTTIIHNIELIKESDWHW